MPEADTHCDSAAAGETPALPKRRKVRKGTQSCWECKRRKIRCTFAAPTERICDGCRSRRTKCISQEFCHEEALASKRIDRLGRMESLVEKLVKQSSADMPDTLRRNQPNQAESAESLVYSRDDQFYPNSELQSSVPIAVPDLALGSNVTNSLDELSRVLLAVWPSQPDLNLILSVLVDVSALFHGVVCMPYSRFTRQLSSPQRMLQLPPEGSHPVLIARRLLMLGALLQGIPPCSVEKLTSMDSDYRTVMSRVVHTASRLVTSDDELVSSLDGIECIMIESMYLNNAGNIRRAWVTNRRAMSIAQMMGLHNGTNYPSMALELETRDRIDADYMWFRLVHTDRYLSLMLGLPQGSRENVFASPEALKSCTAMECMERNLGVAAGLILERNSAERTDLAATYMVDKMLQEAAALMPPQWWLMTPGPAATASNDAGAFEESIRLTNQFTHRHLLVQLHLPYVIQPSSTDPSYDYSKMTAANASRAIVAQFVAFRESNLATAYCRGIDFVVFVASTVLCLTHIEARRQQKTDPGKGVPVFQSLQHQRLSDRGLLQRTLEIMETMAQRNHDVIAQKISSILQPLLAIENNSARGGCYHTSASSELDKQEPGCLREKGEKCSELRIHIPYFGTVKIKSYPTISDTTEPQALSEDWHKNASASQTADTSPILICEPELRLNREQHKAQQKETAAANRAAGYDISAAQPVNADWQAVPSYLNPLDQLQESGSANWDQVSSSLENSSGPQEAHLLVPGLAADIDDWALQGVDIALFSSLT
ncbi:hypothetical protein F5B20DRAFT_432602 [Whalleya microplaca]|nr:hypothetical protein F5B20DRAFT_432602 [Whalleya microplaca]